MPIEPARVNNLVRQHVALFFQRELFIEECLITVSEVICSADLNSATLYITVLPVTKESEALKKIRNKLPELSRFLLNKTSLRKIPKLKVRIDEGERNAREIEKILEGLDFHE